MKYNVFISLLLVFAIQLKSQTIEGRNYKDLISEKKILREIPKVIRGIWRGRITFSAQGGSEMDSLEESVIDLCNYPIKSKNIEKNYMPPYGTNTFNYLYVIGDFKEVAARNRRFYSTTLFGINKEGKVKNGFKTMNYYQKENILTEENYSEDNQLRWKVEYKYEKCR